MKTTPPTFAEIPLLGADSAACSGAAFELDPAREPEVVALDGCEAEVREGQRTILVRCGSEVNYDDAIRAGLATAQKALDLMSMRGGKVAEGESAWFKRALGEAYKIVALAPLAPAGSADPVQDLFDELYVNMRSAMSHAKSGRRVLLPQDEGERADVTASLRRLVGLYLKLAETHLGARRPGGGMFAIAFRMMVAPTLKQMSMYVSDDESPFGKSEASPNPAGGAMKVLAPTGDVDTSGSFVVTRLWSAPAADLSDLPFVRRVVGVVHDMPAMAAVLNGRLVLGSAQRLEAVMGARGSNTRQPRDRYSY